MNKRKNGEDDFKYVKGKKNKKVLATGGVLLAMAIAVGSFAVVNFNTNVKASEGDVSYESILPAMEMVAEEYAEDFVENNNDIDVAVDKATPIYDTEGSIVGYSVALVKDNTDYGYVNIDYTSEALVTDFSVSKDSDSIYDALTDNFVESEANIDKNDCEDKLVSVNGIDYAVTATTDNNESKFYYNGITYESDDFEDMLNHYEENYLEYYDNTEYEDDFIYSQDNETKEERELSIGQKFKNWVAELYPGIYNSIFAKDGYVAPTAYPNHDEVFKNEAMCELETQVMLPQYSKEKSLLSQKEVMTTTNRYACELVGITAICLQENMSLNGNLKDTFNKLWDLAGCEGRIYQTGTFYGEYTVDCSSTYTSDMPYVVKKYASLFNKKVTAKYKKNPKFSFFKNSIDNKCSTSFGYSIKKEGGHGVNVVGYAQGYIGNHDVNYIITGDSWFDDAPRFVLYGRGLFASSEGNSFKIQDK